jgi:16S rRNA (guanine(966)-N(2))-methyltransferase RsmD
MGADLTRVLDLYAGTGALGIEALSRGAGWCDFVEKDRAMAEVIRENLALTGLRERAKVYPIASERALEALPERYTLVLADPPYADASAWAVLERLASSPLLAAEALVVVEHSARDEPRGDLGPLALVKALRHGDSEVSVYQSAAGRTEGS